MHDNGIILINYTGKKGGGALVAYETTKALIERGEKVAAVVSEQIENIDMWRKLGLIKLVEIPTYNSMTQFAVNTLLFNFRQKKYIKKQLDGFEFEYIYAPMLTEWTDKINSIFSGAKTVVTIHDPIPHSGRRRMALLRKFYNYDNACKKADALIVHTKKFITYVEEKFSKKGRTFYIPLGRHNMYKDLKEKEHIIDYDKEKTNFLFFGRISKYKGLDILAMAYKKVYEKNSNVTLSIVGNGDFSEYSHLYEGLSSVKIINRWIKDQEVEDVFIGDNLVAVCPYKDATQSGVIMLAQDYRVPVIATNTGGIDEQIKDGETGLLLDTCSADELAEKMLLIANDKELYTRLANNTQEYIKAFSWDNSVEKLVNIMHQI